MHRKDAKKGEGKATCMRDRVKKNLFKILA
jgi:hypothetical protein